MEGDADGDEELSVDAEDVLVAGAAPVLPGQSVELPCAMSFGRFPRLYWPLTQS